MGKIPLSVWILGSVVIVCIVLGLRYLGNEPVRRRVIPSPWNAALSPGSGLMSCVHTSGRSIPETGAGGGEAVSAHGTGRMPAHDSSNELKQRLPNTILIGVKKGGTRALIEMLSLHPCVKAAAEEVHFFDRSYNYMNGLSWYRKQMKVAGPNDIVIEKSPAYFVTKDVPVRIKEDLSPDVKLLLVLRNPVDRVVSDFMQGQHRRRGEMVHVAKLSPQELEEMQATLTGKILSPNGDVNPKSNFISVGLYWNHLQRWLKHFDRRQIYITSTDDLVARPVEVVEEISRFLCLPSFPWGKHIVRVAGSKFACLNRSRAPGKKAQVTCLNGTKGREHIPIPADLREELVAFFRPHNEQLFQAIGKTFDTWRHERRRSAPPRAKSDTRPLTVGQFGRLFYGGKTGRQRKQRKRPDKKQVLAEGVVNSK